MRYHYNYWSESKLAKWILPARKLSSGTHDEWKSWEEWAKSTYPIRFWIVEVFIDKMQDICYWPFNKLNDIRYYLKNRFINKSHALIADPTHLRPGQWCEIGDRILPCLFDSLVEFVEKHEGVDDINWKAKLVYTVEDGLEEDDPRIGTPTNGAIAAVEVRALYLWWTQVYPNRPDPYDVSGLTKFYETQRTSGRNPFDRLLSDQETWRQMMDRCIAIEDSYQKEDTEMLIRLVSIRDCLWT